MPLRPTRLVLIASLTAALSCAAVAPAPAPTLSDGRPKGFLTAQTVPDGIALLPAPPATPKQPPLPLQRSAAFALDVAVMESSLQFRGARWDLAALDADLSYPGAPGAFTCALGAPISEKDTPHLYALMSRASADASLGMSAAKNKYNRTRPFVLNGKPTCAPKDEEALKHNGSYPSGHAALGWTWALVLAEIAPDRQDAILRRGWAFGESRIVCNVHWFSDIVQARALASGVVARLHAEREFQDAVAAARKELAEVRARGLAPSRDCAQEAAALEGTPLFPVADAPSP